MLATSTPPATAVINASVHFRTAGDCANRAQMISKGIAGCRNQSGVGTGAAVALPAVSGEGKR